MLRLLADDINTPGALARLHAIDDPAVLKASAALTGLLGDEIGGWDRVDLSAWADELGALRAAAMASKDFAAVDAMKAALVAAGVEVRMSKAGIDLAPAAGFDAAKLPEIA